MKEHVELKKVLGILDRLAGLMGDDETPAWKSEGDRSWLDALKHKDEGFRLDRGLLEVFQVYFA